ncbi:hypothetical protein BD410DRAFT_782756 [Rickenella mellea]|uniref:F-box domain-containing protein n=1 Tax=Rickenella mellea TaxID=50990 RepID=A0A4Y7QJN9_9AGAM|nr:hypothetical protein BD410DRAFT_782756 [Rickenella mellea]
MTFKFPQPTDILQSWIYVTHVCQRWRQLALGYAPLWTILSDSQSDEETEAYISRSKCVPLEVFTCSVTVDPSHATVHKRILRELPRTSHITILLTDDSETADDLLTSLWKHPTPCLRSITFARESGSPTDWLAPITILPGPHPALRSLSLHDCHISWDSSLLRGLSSLRVDFIPPSCRPTMMDVYTILSACPDLRRLTLIWAPPSDVFIHPNIPRIHLPHLHTFDIAMDATKWAALLSLPELPGNIDFSIVCSPFPSTSPIVIVPQMLPLLPTPQNGMSVLVVSIKPKLLSISQGLHRERKDVALPLADGERSIDDLFCIFSGIIKSTAWSSVTTLTVRFLQRSGESGNKNMWINVFQAVPKLRSFFLVLVDNCEGNPDRGLPEALCSRSTSDPGEELFPARELFQMVLVNLDFSESIKVYSDCLRLRLETAPLVELALINCRGVDKELLEKNVGTLWIDPKVISLL